MSFLAGLGQFLNPNLLLGLGNAGMQSIGNIFAGIQNQNRWNQATGAQQGLYNRTMGPGYGGQYAQYPGGGGPSGNDSTGWAGNLANAFGWLDPLGAGKGLAGIADQFGQGISTAAGWNQPGQSGQQGGGKQMGTQDPYNRADPGSGGAPYSSIPQLSGDMARRYQDLVGQTQQGYQNLQQQISGMPTQQPDGSWRLQGGLGQGVAADQAARDAALQQSTLGRDIGLQQDVYGRGQALAGGIAAQGQGLADRIDQQGGQLQQDVYGKGMGLANDLYGRGMGLANDMYGRGQGLANDLYGRGQALSGQIGTGYQNLTNTVTGQLGQTRDRVLAGLQGSGDQERRDINQQFNANNAAQQADLTARGLDSTTIGASMQSGNERQRADALGGLNQRIMDQRAGYDTSLSNNITNAQMGLGQAGLGAQMGLGQFNIGNYGNASQNALGAYGAGAQNALGAYGAGAQNALGAYSGLGQMNLGNASGLGQMNLGNAMGLGQMNLGNYSGLGQSANANQFGLGQQANANQFGLAQNNMANFANMGQYGLGATLGAQGNALNAMGQYGQLPFQYDQALTGQYQNLLASRNDQYNTPNLQLQSNLGQGSVPAPNYPNPFLGGILGPVAGGAAGGLAAGGIASLFGGAGGGIAGGAALKGMVFCISGDCEFIRHDGEIVTLRDIQIGERVMSRDGTYKTVTLKAYGQSDNGKGYIRITHPLGQIVLTRDHLLRMADETHREAGAIEIGDMLAGRYGDLAVSAVDEAEPCDSGCIKFADGSDYVTQGLVVVSMLARVPREKLESVGAA